MPNRERIGQLTLSGQLVTADSTSLYLNGAAIGGVSAATVQSTGQQAWTAANANGTNISGNMAATGAALGLADASISGFAQRKSQMIVTFSSAPLTWSAMPLAQTFFNASFGYTTYLDLTQFTGVNLVVTRTATAGAASGALYLGYLGNPSSTAANYLNLDTNATRVRLATTNTVATSGFNPIVAAARSGVYVALLGSSGNASLGPTFGMVTAIFQ